MTCVAIFDSGVGGLSIYQEVRSRLPECNYIYIGDNLAYPYGDKSEQQITQRVMQLMPRIIEQFQPDLAIVACNTASTVVLPLLREECTMPVIGVVPAIKPASQLSKTKHIGLLATPGTLQRSYTAQLIENFAADCKFTKVASSNMVTIAEQKMYGQSVDIDMLERELQPFLTASGCDVLVLACTHYPLLNKEISDIFKANNKTVMLVDSGAGIARRVEFLITQNCLLSTGVAYSKAVF